MFERLEFVYMPSRDVAADIAHYAERLGGEVVFAIERFETRVAMVSLAPGAPRLLLAQHLEGERPILLFRVADLDAACSELESRGLTLGPRFEFPFGFGNEITNPGPQRLAICDFSRAERGESITGRMDF